ncbi:hypothetical protein KC947_01405 [Candidatus Saccharibacteria bacterium]|nr:hypothetical protein [Candidatus Saccharibacteria bacterium]
MNENLSSNIRANSEVNPAPREVSSEHFRVAAEAITRQRRAHKFVHGHEKATGDAEGVTIRETYALDGRNGNVVQETPIREGQPVNSISRSNSGYTGYHQSRKSERYFENPETRKTHVNSRAVVYRPKDYGYNIYDTSLSAIGTGEDNSVPLPQTSAEIVRLDPKTGEEIYRHTFKNPKAPELITRLAAKSIERTRRIVRRQETEAKHKKAT